MTRFRTAGALALLLASASVGARAGVALQPVASGLDNITTIANARDGSGRLFVTLQGGLIRVYDGTQVLPTPFLDLRSFVSTGGSEQGLLGLAFHPNYATTGYFYVDYTDLSGNTVIARYLRSAADPNIGDPASATTLLTIVQPFSNHNGGQLAFGPDGYLYIAMGDGGSGGDPLNNGQNLGTLLGKILPIDVDNGSPYVIPASNPFASSATARHEIWAYGLRNPWRFSFDRQTGDLLIGDVGQGTREEIDFQPAASPGGENYGWRLMEGSLCFDPPTRSPVGRAPPPSPTTIRRQRSRSTMSPGPRATPEPRTASSSSACPR